MNSQLKPLCAECGGNHEPSGSRTDCINYWKGLSQQMPMVCSDHQWPYGVGIEGDNRPMCVWCEALRADALEKKAVDAIRERDACHKIWDDFVTKLSAVFPSAKNAPLFQIGDDILNALRHRDRLEKLARERGEAEIKLKLALEEILEKANCYEHQVHWCREVARKALL